MTRKDIIDKALSLPLAERAQIVRELLASLDADETEDAAAAWLVEVEQRAGEVEDGQAILEDWDALRGKLLSKLRRE